MRVSGPVRIPTNITSKAALKRSDRLNSFRGGAVYHYRMSYTVLCTLYHYNTVHTVRYWVVSLQHEIYSYVCIVPLQDGTHSSVFMVPLQHDTCSSVPLQHVTDSSFLSYTITVRYIILSVLNWTIKGCSMQFYTVLYHCSTAHTFLYWAGSLQHSSHSSTWAVPLPLQNEIHISIHNCIIITRHI